MRIARIMGYANTSTLYRIRKHAAFPDVERLERLLETQPAPGVVVSLNWIVAGLGQPLLRVSKGEVQGEMSMGDFVDRYSPGRASGPDRRRQSPPLGRRVRN